MSTALKISNLLPEKSQAGRPKAITESVLEKLYHAWSIGASDATACKYAGIDPQTLYSYQKTNKDFFDWKNTTKQETLLEAHNSVKESLPKRPDIAFKYLEKRDARFKNTQDINVNRTDTINQDQIQGQLTNLLNSNPDIAKKIIESLTHKDLQDTLDNKLKPVYKIEK